jgi:very-short-patch-repair endonuclease
MAERRRPEDYYVLARDRNAVWLGPEVANANTRTRWACRTCGRRWWAIFNSLKRGTACPQCGIRKRADTQRATPEAYHALASARGFRWLGPSVAKADAKTGWRCSEGHDWQASYSKLRQGRGCPTCARRLHTERSHRQRHPPARYRALARSHHLRWIGPVVPNANTKTEWECSRGRHRWWATYNKIKQARGCPTCAVDRRADSIRHTPDAYHDLARKRGFRWLGPPVRRVAEPTGWCCSRGHTWQTTYNAVQQGSGCPVCNDRVNGRPVSALQRRLCRRLGGELNHPVGRYCVDVALVKEGVRIAVEFDAWYYHGGREQADEQRDAFLIASGWRVLRIRSSRALPTRDELEAALRRLVGGETRVVLTLAGWGSGPVRRDRRGK